MPAPPTTYSITACFKMGNACMDNGHVCCTAPDQNANKMCDWKALKPKNHLHLHSVTDWQSVARFEISFEACELVSNDTEQDENCNKYWLDQWLYPTFDNIIDPEEEKEYFVELRCCQVKHAPLKRNVQKLAGALLAPAGPTSGILFIIGLF